MGKNDQQQVIGVLLCNLGTPDAPTAKALKNYLAEFLWDPRVVEMPRWKWWLILHGIILQTRPKKSAEAYRRVWSEAGSPLLKISQSQRTLMEKKLADHHDVHQVVHVVLGMRYGNPSMKDALQQLKSLGCTRIVVLPLYPQYSASTTASSFDSIAKELVSWRFIPELYFINGYHHHPNYIAALASSVRRHWKKFGRADQLLISFHGVPQRYIDAGDPYFDQCHHTSQLLRESLQLKTSEAVICFQSRFGSEPWVKPYIDDILKQQARSGIKVLDVICPGFSADCLETLDEIAVESQETFISAGGHTLRYIPALNDDSMHIDALYQLLQPHLHQ